MLALRRHLDLLSEQVLENDYLVNQSRYSCLCTSISHDSRDDKIIIFAVNVQKEL
jgi:alpha-L-arabinofuranosidase